MPLDPVYSQQTSGPDLIFSHRWHLAREGTVCEDCHGTAGGSLRSEESNLPEEKACLRCHDGLRARADCKLCHRNPGSVRSGPSATRSYRFSHAAHMALGNAAPILASAIDGGRYLSPPGDARRHLDSAGPCEACHRGVREADLATRAHLPRMADCLVCHPRIDPPFSCTYCHAPEAELKPSSHTARFTEMHSSREAMPDKSSCRVCHGLRFTCMGCH